MKKFIFIHFISHSIDIVENLKENKILGKKKFFFYQDLYYVPALVNKFIEFITKSGIERFKVEKEIEIHKKI